MSSANSKKVSKKWNKYYEGTSIWTFPPIWKHFVKCGFGADVAQIHRDNPNWAADIFIERHLREKKVKSIISICCGSGHMERYFVERLPGIKRCLGVDLSANAIMRAGQVAHEHGLSETISYEVADLNSYDWERHKTCDLVIANGALHHITNLEGVLSGIRRVLKPDGWLFSSECIGPSLQDHPPRHLEIINSFIYLLPPELRGRPSTPFRHKHRLLRNIWIGLKLLKGQVNVPTSDHPTWSPSKKLAAKIGRHMRSRRGNSHKFDFGIVHDSQKQELLRTDPSEGVRSAEIVGIIQSIFSKVYVHQIGGAFLTYVLDRSFFENYDPENRFHVELFERLCALEEFFLAHGEVDPEYALLFAQP